MFKLILPALMTISLSFNMGSCSALNHPPHSVPRPKPPATVVVVVPQKKTVDTTKKAAQKAAQIKKWIKAVQINEWLAAVAANDYHNWPDWPLWHAVGICEQRDVAGAVNAADGIAWGGSPAGGSPESDYPGGLGMSRDFWATYAPQAGVTGTNGALASPADQIRVARAGSHNGTRMGGWSSWPGCVLANGG